MELKNKSIEELEKINTKLSDKKAEINVKQYYIRERIKFLKESREITLTSFEQNKVKEICKKYNVDDYFIYTKSREPKFIETKRAIANYFNGLKYSNVRIAKILGYKQHGSVINLLKNKGHKVNSLES